MFDSKQHASYLDVIFVPRNMELAIEELSRRLEPKMHLFDGFVVTGVSGSGMGFILARELGKSVVVVRKEQPHHSGWDVENLRRKQRLIFLDDFIASGSTLQRVNGIIEAKSKLCSTIDVKIVGALFYDPVCLHWTNTVVKKLIISKTTY